MWAFPMLQIGVGEFHGVTFPCKKTLTPSVMSSKVQKSFAALTKKKSSTLTVGLSSDSVPGMKYEVGELRKVCLSFVSVRP